MSDEVKSKVRAQYTRQAGCYATSETHSLGETLNWLAERSKGARRALDIATGTGFTAFTIAQYAASVVALDMTRAMPEEAQRLARDRGLGTIHFVEGDAEALPFADASLDLVTCRVAAHHFASVPGFLAEAARVLKVGGHLLLIDTCCPEEPVIAEWQENAERLRDPSHVKNLSPSSWLEALRRYGLAPQEFCTTFRISLLFSDWVQRSGTPPEKVQKLWETFSNAPPAVVEAFQITRDEKDIAFSWPVFACQAQRI